MEKYKELLKKDLVDNLDCDLKFDTNKLKDNKKSKDLEISTSEKLEDSTAKEGYFNSYACWKRIIVLINGALFNFISAVLRCI